MIYRQRKTIKSLNKTTLQLKQSVYLQQNPRHSHNSGASGDK